MERSQLSTDKPDELFGCFSKSLFERIFKQNNSSDVIGLYSFYFYTGLWQGTDQPKATDEFCMKYLKWGRQRFYNAKKTLKKMRLIKQIQRGGTKNTFGEYYVKLIFNMRSSYFSRAVENHMSANDSINDDMSQTYGKPAVCLEPVFSKWTSNTMSFKKNAMTEVREPPSVDKEINVCPFNHEIGKDFHSYKDCNLCNDTPKYDKVWTECKHKWNKLRSKNKDNEATE